MRAVLLPPQIERALERGAALAISTSAGKDSQAMLSALVRLHRERGFKGELFAVHADLGRIEWRGTTEHVERICAEAGVPLRIVRRSDGRDMIAHWQARGERLESQGKQPRPWSDAQNRFCTSDLKREPIDRVLREYGHVISAEGIRADESPARAKKPAWKVRSRISNSVRTALTWNPILDWSTEDVWRELGTSNMDLLRRQALHRAGHEEEALDGWKGHYVYVLGNKRLSCSFCVLACESDLRNAATHNPETLRTLVAMEDRFGFDFQRGKPLRRLLSLPVVA
jgi:3'-phosphoadenosine 5'-phosphosulfate sulfotransferase (PAPS reductase)/FAD synthetase